MPTFEITGPGGKIYEVTGPEGSTPEQALARVRAQVAGAGASPAAQDASQAPQIAAPIPTQPAAPSEPPKGVLSRTMDYLGKAGSDAYAGFGAGAVKQFLGLKRMIPGVGLDDEDRRVIEEANKDVHERSNWANVGDIASNALGFAIPGAKIAQGAERAATLLPQALQATGKIVGGGAAASAAQEALMNPESTGKDIAVAATLGGGLNGALGLAGKGVTKMFTPTTETEALMKRGIQPTLGEGAEGNLAKAVAYMTSGMTDPSKHQYKDTMGEVLSTIMPKNSAKDVEPHVLAKMHPDEIVDNIKDYFNRAYEPIYSGKKFTSTQTVRDAMNDTAATVPDSLKPSYNKTMNDIIGSQVGRQKLTAHDLLDPATGIIPRLQSAIENAGTDANGLAMARAFSEAKKIFESQVRDRGIGAAGIAALKDIDPRYADAQRIIDAVERGKSGTRDALAPGKVLNEYFNQNAQSAAGTGGSESKKLLDMAARNMDLGGSQDEARAFWNTAKRLASITLKPVAGAGVIGALGVPAAVPLAISAAGQTKQGAKFLMGGNEWQQKLAEMIRRARPQDYSAPVAAELYNEVHK